jgi:Spy/CpxP family protein refolding chaperone
MNSRRQPNPRIAPIAVLAAALAAGLGASTALAQQAGPGTDPTLLTAPTSAPGFQAGPCPWRQGQGRGGWNGTGDRVASQMDRMAWRLNLTADQKARLEPILRKREELRTAQRQAMRQEIAAILTPEQLTLFEQMGPGRGRGMGPGAAFGTAVPTPTPPSAPAGQP